MTLLHVLSYVGIIAAFAFITLSLASGLLWIAELIEEHSKLAKTIGIRTVYVVIALHVLLYLVDSFPLLQLLFSIVCHIAYLQNFSSTWPFISLTSTSFMTSCILSIANHFVWFFHFSRLSQEARNRSKGRFRNPGNDSNSSAPTFTDIATFFGLCVWLVPLFLFLSLSANDNALPVDSGGPHKMESPVQPTFTPVSTSHTSLFKSIIDFFPRIRQKPRIAEGIIAPSAPSTPSVSTFSRPYGYPPSSPFLPPSRSASVPGHGQSLEGTQSRTRVTLAPPPKRSFTSPGHSRMPSDGEWEDLSDSASLSSRTAKRVTRRAHID